jgi:hypothetical protein
VKEIENKAKQIIFKSFYSFFMICKPLFMCIIFNQLHGKLKIGVGHKHSRQSKGENRSKILFFCPLMVVVVP